MRHTLAAVGSVITIVGLLITFSAVFAAYRHPRIEAAAPWLTRGLRRGHHWAARLLPFLRRDATMYAVTATAMGGSGTLQARPRLWSPIGADDDVEERLRKLNNNLDRLVAEMDERFAEAATDAAATRQELDERIRKLRDTVEAAAEETRRSEAEALPLEVGGLLVALIGAILTAVATL